MTNYSGKSIYNTLCRGGDNAYVIYAESIFIVNFLMDIVLLMMVKKIRKLPATIWRIITGAIIGSGAVLLCCLFTPPVLIEYIMTLFILPILMIRISFGSNKPKDTLLSVIVLYLISAFLGGTIQIIFYHTPLDHDLYMNAYVKYSDIKYRLASLIAGTMIVWVLLLCFFNRKYEQVIGNRDICKVILTIHGERVAAKGLIDTGNSLYDPVSHKPVGVIYSDFFQKYFNEDDWTKVRIIPMKTVGGISKILTAVCIDQVDIFLGDRDFHLNKVYMALNSQRLNGCEVLLHPEFLDDKGHNQADRRLREW